MEFKYMINYAYQNLAFLDFVNRSFNKFIEIFKASSSSNQKEIISDFGKEHDKLIENYNNAKIKNINDNISAEKTKKIKEYAKSLSINLNENFNLKDLSDLIEQKINPEIAKTFQKIIGQIDINTTFKLFTISISRYIVENYEISINILLNIRKLYNNENTKLTNKLNKYLDISINMEEKNKKLEGSKNSYYNETIRLKNIIDSLTLQKTNVEKKVMELNDKIEVLMKNEKIIKN